MNAITESTTSQRLDNAHLDIASPTAECPVLAHIKQALQQSGYRELRLTSCDFHDGVVTLHGTVRSYYLKQVAQSVVLQVPQVCKVRNRMHVLDSQREQTPKPR